MHSHPEFPDELARGSVGAFTNPDLPGLDRVRGEFATGLMPPQYYISGLRAVAVESGLSRFEMPVSGWWLDETGGVSSAAAGFAIDAPVGSSVLSTLGPRQVSPTAELTVVYLTDVPAEMTALSCEAKMVWSDGDTGVSNGRVTSADGTVIAQAVTRIAITTLPSVVPDLPAFSDAEDPPHPFLRTPPPFVDFDGSGKARLAEAIAAPETRVPIDRLLAFQPVDHTDDSMTAVAHVNDWFVSPSGQIYGGFTAAIVQRAAELVTMMRADRPVPARTLDLKLQFHRPLLAAATPVTATARIVHMGGRVGSVRVELHLPDGRLAVTGAATLRARSCRT